MKVCTTPDPALPKFSLHAAHRRRMTACSDVPDSLKAEGWGVSKLPLDQGFFIPCSEECRSSRAGAASRYFGLSKIQSHELTSIFEVKNTRLAPQASWNADMMMHDVGRRWNDLISK